MYENRNPLGGLNLLPPLLLDAFFAENMFMIKIFSLFYVCFDNFLICYPSGAERPYCVSNARYRPLLLSVFR